MTAGCGFNAQPWQTVPCHVEGCNGRINRKFRTTVADLSRCVVSHRRFFQIRQHLPKRLDDATSPSAGPATLAAFTLMESVADAAVILGYSPTPLNNHFTQRAAARGDTITWVSSATFAGITDFTPFDSIYVPHSRFNNPVFNPAGLTDNTAWRDGSGGVNLGRVALVGFHSEHHFQTGARILNDNLLSWVDDGNSSSLGVIASRIPATQRLSIGCRAQTLPEAVW